MARGDHKEALIRTGLQLLPKTGYAGTGLNEIMQAAGVPKGSFYHYFGSKEAFAQEVARRYYAAHREFLQTFLAESAGSAGARLAAYLKGVHDDVVAPGQDRFPGCLLGGLALQVTDETLALRTTVNELFAKWRAQLAVLVAQAQAAGEIDPGRDPDALAGFILAGLEGALMQTRLTGDGEPLREWTRQLLDSVLLSD